MSGAFDRNPVKVYFMVNLRNMHTEGGEYSSRVYAAAVGGGGQCLFWPVVSSIIVFMTFMRWLYALALGVLISLHSVIGRQLWCCGGRKGDSGYAINCCF